MNMTVELGRFLSGYRTNRLTEIVSPFVGQLVDRKGVFEELRESLSPRSAISTSKPARNA